MTLGWILCVVRPASQVHAEMCPKESVGRTCLCVHVHVHVRARVQRI